MLRKLAILLICLCLLMPLAALVAGCDELTDAAHGAKGTASMQQRRQHRNNEAINLVVDQAKKK